MLKKITISFALCCITTSVHVYASKPLAALSAVTKSQAEGVKPPCPSRPAPKRPGTPTTSTYAQNKASQQERWSVIMRQAKASLPVHLEHKSDETLPASGPAFIGLIPIPVGSDAETIRAGLLTIPTK